MVERRFEHEVVSPKLGFTGRCGALFLSFHSSLGWIMFRLERE